MAIKIDKKISIATVYRTVKLLEEYNIIDKHDFKAENLGMKQLLRHIMII